MTKVVAMPAHSTMTASRGGRPRLFILVTQQVSQARGSECRSPEEINRTRQYNVAPSEHTDHLPEKSGSLLHHGLKGHRKEAPGISQKNLKLGTGIGAVKHHVMITWIEWTRVVVSTGERRDDIANPGRGPDKSR